MPVLPLHRAHFVEELLDVAAARDPQLLRLFPGYPARRVDPIELEVEALVEPAMFGSVSIVEAGHDLVDPFVELGVGPGALLNDRGRSPERFGSLRSSDARSCPYRHS